MTLQNEEAVNPASDDFFLKVIFTESGFGGATFDATLTGKLNSGNGNGTVSINFGAAQPITFAGGSFADGFSGRVRGQVASAIAHCPTVSASLIARTRRRQVSEVTRRRIGSSSIRVKAIGLKCFNAGRAPSTLKSVPQSERRDPRLPSELRRSVGFRALKNRVFKRLTQEVLSRFMPVKLYDRLMKAKAAPALAEFLPGTQRPGRPWRRQQERRRLPYAG